MGNRWSAYTEPISAINPAGSPYLHIQPVSLPNSSNGGRPEMYAYVPSVGAGLEACVGLVVPGRRNNGTLLSAADFQELSVPVLAPMLPAIETVPPPQISTHERIETVIEQLFNGRGENLTAALAEHPDANAILLSHGVKWGLLPLNKVSERLMMLGYEVRKYSQVGRAHRIPDFVLSLSRL